MAREIRVTFTDKEEALYNYIISKSSKTAFLKDLAALEKKREENYINSGIENKVKEIAEEIITIVGSTTDLKKNSEDDKDDKKINNEYDFDINDLDLD